MQDEIAAVVRLLKHVRVLDCGAHYCRYCPAKSEAWEHTPGCPYEESQRIYSEAQAMIARLSAASSSPGETRDVNAELLAALKDVVGDAAGEACDPLWIVRAEVISRGAIAIAKATASPHGPSSREGR
jgi:hypothetical protein